MLTSLPPIVPAARALPLLLPLLTARGAPSAAGPDTTIYAANATGAATAIDAENGAILWRYHC
jgi:outer membrane protein assembly factor BamB